MAAVEQADVIATVRISYAEARAAFARLQREGDVTRPVLRHMVRELDRDWAAYDVVEIVEPLVRHAGALAERHALRGYDAVQLAAALSVHRVVAEVQFLSFDIRLTNAAARERLARPRSA